MFWPDFKTSAPLKRGHDRRGHRFRRIPARLLLPSLITLLALCSGVTAIRMAVEGRYQLATGAIVLAIILDAVDGRLARFLKSASRFGAELDSLADFVNFGVAPAILIYLWSLHALDNLGWIVALALAICCALRLARFNVVLDEPGKPAFAENYFVGVPAPAAAGLALLPMYIGFLGLVHDGEAIASIVLAYIAVIGLLMVSRAPTFSGKTIGRRIHRDMVMPVLLIVVLVTALLISFPWIMLSGFALCYLTSLPIGLRSYARQSRRYNARQAMMKTEDEIVRSEEGSDT
ncbi:MAG: phosphatidylcholine/phosphatidylserine synthase [Hyphomicrobiales bacterium]